jgi:hypothetical protein
MLKINSDLFYVKNKETYPPFKNGLYLEEYFLEFMIKYNREYDNFGRRYIPALWTNFQIESWFSEKEKCEEMQNALDEYIRMNPSENGYFTVVQHDDGPMLKLPPNTVVYGSCTGDIPIPLIYEDNENKLVSFGKNNKKSYKERGVLSSFIGSSTHPIRNTILELYSKNPHFYIFSADPFRDWDGITKNKQLLFINATLNSKFALAPRGYGRSSFRFFEILQLGIVPIYVWDDINWLPYKDVIDYSKFCISIHKNDLPNLETLLLSIDETKYNRMVEEGKIHSHFFTLEYMCQYILYNRTALGDSTSDSINGNKTQIDIKISLCIPTMNRFDDFLGGYLDKYIDYLNSGIIDEIVICDENGDDFYKIYMKYGCFISNNPNKIRVVKNDEILGVFLNKKKVCSLARNKYIALIDSDNFADENYFKTATEYIINNELPENFVLAPSFAKPLFDFTTSIGTINKNNMNDFLDRHMFHIFLNTGNYILSNNLHSNIQYDVELLPKISSCDVIYLNLLCFQQLENFEMHIVEGMEYSHVIHRGSTQLNNCHIGDYYLNSIIIPAYYQLSPKKIMPISEKLKQPFYSLGNKLIDYFAKMGFAFSCGNNFQYDLPYYLNTKDNIFILQNLPYSITLNNEFRDKFKNIHLQRVLGDNYLFAGDYANLWELTNNDRLQFWSYIKPIANNLINKILSIYNENIVNNVNNLGKFPIIHFRCSDVPFIRHGFYHFQRYEFFIDSLKELAGKGIDVSKVYLMVSFLHEGSEKKNAASLIYIQSLKQFLEENNYVVEIISQDVASDFAALFYAPAVISTCSSFSFTAGFFGNGIFITEGHYNEDFESGSVTESPCYAPFIKKGYSVNHSRILDYYDTDAVIKILKS